MKKPSQKLIHSKRKSRFSLLEKIYGTFAVILVFTFFSAYASFQSAQRTTLASHWVDHTYRVLWHLDHFYSALQAATSHQRAYLLTNQKIFLIRYHHSAEVVMRSLRQLGPMIADNPIEQGNLTLLQKAVAKRLNASDTLIKESSHHISNATRMAKMQKGLNAMAEIRNTVANMETEEGGLLKSRLASEERRARKLRIALSVEILLTILFLAFSLWIISRQISNNQYFQMEKERLENEIISMMTHELRNPLTVIYSALTALADHYSKNPSS